MEVSGSVGVGVVGLFTVAHAVEARFLLLGADASQHQGTETEQDGSRQGRKAMDDEDGPEWRGAETAMASSLREPGGRPVIIAGTMADPSSIWGSSEEVLTASGAARAEPAIHAERLDPAPMRARAVQPGRGLWTQAVRGLMRRSQQTP